mmetsp:Transcript_50701/g.128738  ORF Transcript_50701/g.128738 Transcript_50701/m.128738 type:complete len:317 (-) Transcript_50701:203-1153(-)
MAAQALFLRVRDGGGCADANDDQDASPVLTTLHLGLRGLRDTVAFDSLLEQDRTKDGRKHGADGRKVGIRVQTRQLVQQYGEDLVRHTEHHEGCRGDHLADIQLEVRDGKPAPAREDDRRTHQDRPLNQNRRHGTGVAGISELQQCGKEQARDHCAHIVVEHETPRRKLGLRDQVLDQDAVQGHEHEVEHHPSGGVHQQALVRRGVSDGAEQNDAEARPRANGGVRLVQNHGLQQGTRDGHDRAHDDEGVNVGRGDHCVARGDGDEEHACRWEEFDQLAHVQRIDLDEPQPAGEVCDHGGEEELQRGERPDERELL